MLVSYRTKKILQARTRAITAVRAFKMDSKRKSNLFQSIARNQHSSKSHGVSY